MIGQIVASIGSILLNASIYFLIYGDQQTRRKIAFIAVSYVFITASFLFGINNFFLLLWPWLAVLLYGLLHVHRLLFSFIDEKIKPVVSSKLISAEQEQRLRKLFYSQYVVMQIIIAVSQTLLQLLHIWDFWE
jgi:hypothetical protein